MNGSKIFDKIIPSDLRNLKFKAMTRRNSHMDPIKITLNLNKKNEQYFPQRKIIHNQKQVSESPLSRSAGKSILKIMTERKKQLLGGDELEKIHNKKDLPEQLKYMILKKSISVKKVRSHNPSLNSPITLVT